MSKLFVPVTLVVLSLLALTIAERRLDNSKELKEARDGHIEEHRPKKLFGKLKRQKSHYGPPKVHHRRKKPQYGPPPVVYGSPQPVVYGPPSQAYGNPKPIHPAPQANYRTPPYPHHPPQTIAYNQPGPVYSQPGPPQSSYGPPTYAGPQQIVYNRPSQGYPKPAPSQPVYVQPVASPYSQPAPAEHYNPAQVHVTKPEVTYSPPAPSYSAPQVQVTQTGYHQPSLPDHDDSQEDDRKPSEDVPQTTGYNTPHSAHVEQPTATYVGPEPQHYGSAEPNPVVRLPSPAYVEAKPTGNAHQQPVEQLQETPIYEPPSSGYGSSQPENNQPVLEDSPPKQTAYITKRPSYSEDTSYNLPTGAPSVPEATDSSSSTDDEDENYSPPSESDFPSLFDHSSNFYKQPDNAPDAKDDYGFFQLGLFPKTSSFFEQNYKG